MTLAALVDLYTMTGESAKSAQAFQRLAAYHSPGGAGHPHPHPAGATNATNHADPAWALFLANHDRELDEALRIAEGAAEMSRSVFVYDALAWCYYKKGLYKEAQKAIHKALRWKTPDAAMLFHAGMIYAGLGDRAEAQRYLYQALNLNPHFDPIQAKIAAETLQQLPHPKKATHSNADDAQRTGR